MRISRTHFLLAIFLSAITVFPLRGWLKRKVTVAGQANRGKNSVADRVEQFGPAVRKRLKPAFDEVGADYRPQRITLVGIKQDNLLEVWVSDPPKLLKTYPILGASGGPGPKLKQGDRQVPEGIYEIESLNPNSRYHLALRLNYPNAFDLKNAKAEGRSDPGGDIMIHGNTCSIGCLAMGDEAAEDLFVLAAETGIENITVILTPVDFRKHDLPETLPPELPDWAAGLYKMIKGELLKLTAEPIN